MKVISNLYTACILAGALLPFAACSDNNSGTPAEQETVLPPVAEATSASPHPGLAVYEMRCSSCHGKDGTAGTSGAANLQLSQLDSAGAAQIILKGKGMMPAFESLLNAPDARSVTSYATGLRKSK